jgi:hypothetical protein
MSLLSKDNIEGRKLGTDVSILCKHHSTLNNCFCWISFTASTDFSIFEKVQPESDLRSSGSTKDFEVWLRFTEVRLSDFLFFLVHFRQKKFNFWGKSNLWSGLSPTSIQPKFDWCLTMIFERFDFNCWLCDSPTKSEKTFDWTWPNQSKSVRLCWKSSDRLNSSLTKSRTKVQPLLLTVWLSISNLHQTSEVEPSNLLIFRENLGRTAVWLRFSESNWRFLRSFSRTYAHTHRSTRQRHTQTRTYYTTEAKTNCFIFQICFPFSKPSGKIKSQWLMTVFVEFRSQHPSYPTNAQKSLRPS